MFVKLLSLSLVVALLSLPACGKKNCSTDKAEKKEKNKEGKRSFLFRK